MRRGWTRALGHEGDTKEDRHASLLGRRADQQRDRAVPATAALEKTGGGVRLGI